MADWTYERGAWPAILGDRMAVVLAGAEAERFARVLLARRPPTAPEEVLDALVAGGLRAAPAFAIARLEGDTLTAFVRGPLAIAVEDERWAVQRHSGASLRTWREVVVERVTRLAIVADDADDARAALAPAQAERIAPEGPLSVGRLVYRAPGLGVSAAAEAGRTVDYQEAVVSGILPAPAPPAPAAPAPARAPAPAPARDQGIRPGQDDPRQIGLPTPNPLMPAGGEAPPTTEMRFDDLFGATRNTAVEAAAVRPHDDAAALDDPAAEVSAVLCPTGHPNPPTRSDCAICGAPLDAGRIGRVDRLDLGRIRLADGRTVPIDGTIIVGRSPRVERTGADGIPALLALGDASGDISRNHLRVTVEGWTVLVEDLGSTNGTVLTDAAGSRRLRPGEPAIVSDGAVADLGGGVVLRFEGTP